MGKHRVPKDIWFLTSCLGLALICSVLSAMGWREGLVTACTIGLVGMCLVIWLRRLITCELPLWRLSESLRNGKETCQTSVLGGDGYSAIAAGILDRRSSCGEIVKTCYETAARVSVARDTVVATGNGVLKAIKDVRERCVGLKAALTKAREAPDSPKSRAQATQRGANPAVLAEHHVDATHPAMSSILDDIILAVREMGETLREFDNNAKELIASTEETAYSMSRLDSFLQDMANSGKELESSTDTANRVALEGTKVVEEMAKENEVIIATVKEAATSVEDLGRWSQEVGKIVEVIGDIADQTNLLALNAAIIAAQSGEHGKAFGVVAEEIRGLAERTSSSTREINDLVEAVQHNVANVVQGMKKSLQRVERGELLTRNAGMVLEKVFESFESSRDMAKQIAASTFEHKIDSSHVVRSIHRVTDIARRLESHKSGKWTSGETLATAAVMKALSKNGSFEDDGQLITSRVNDVLVRTEEDLDRTVSSLEHICEEVSKYVALVDELADNVRSQVREIHMDTDEVGVRKCWQIADCDRQLRDQCPAHQQDDWRCFLTDGVGCSFAGDGSTHAQKKCPECPVFRSNMEALVTQTVGSQK